MYYDGDDGIDSKDMVRDVQAGSGPIMGKQIPHGEDAPLQRLLPEFSWKRFFPCSYVS